MNNTLRREVIWQDTKTLTPLTSFDTYNPVSRVERYDRSIKQEVNPLLQNYVVIRIYASSTSAQLFDGLTESSCTHRTNTTGCFYHFIDLTSSFASY